MAASIVSEHLVKDRTIISDINGQNVEVFFSYLQSDILRNIVKILLSALLAKPISEIFKLSVFTQSLILLKCRRHTDVPYVV